MLENLKKNEGFILLMVLGFICISSFFLYTGLEVLSGSLKADASLKEERCRQTVQRNVQEGLWMDAITSVQNDRWHLSIHSVNTLFEYVLPEDIFIKDVWVSDLSDDIFAKEMDQMAVAKIAHPLHNKRGKVVIQNCGLTFYKKDWLKAYRNQFEISYKAIPSTEFAFISTSVRTFSPKNSKINLIINGDALVPSYDEKGAGAEMEFKNLFCKTYIEDNPFKFTKPGRTIIKNQLWASHKFIFTYGVHPSNYLIPSNDEGLYPSQIYSRHQGARVIYFDGNGMSEACPGVSVRNFNEGAMRVVIDLAQAHGHSYPKLLYIYCTTEKAKDVGIVIKGATVNYANAPLGLITNGKVWLWGDHLGSPIMVGSTFGNWILTDNTWKENENAIRPLDLIWKGYLMAPAERVSFYTPQLAGEKGQLTVNGTLLIGGNLFGNLGRIHVTENAEVAKALADFSERLVVPVAVKQIE